MEGKLEQLVSRLEAATARLESISLKGGAGGDAAPSAATVQEFDKYFEESVKPFFDVSTKLGGDLNGATDLVRQSFGEVRKIIEIASRAKKPADSELVDLLKPLFALFDKIADYRAKKRGDFYEHLSAINEGIGCLKWVGITGAPAGHVKEMIASAQFYSNKILVKYRKTDETQVEWVNALKKLISDLEPYVKEYHTTGLAWNPKGVSFAEALASAGSSSPAASSGSSAPPPPPPGNPPPPPVVTAAETKSQDNSAGLDKVFEQIRSGNVTGGLKHVSKEMKTKNMPNRSSVVPASVGKKTTAKFSGKKPRGPPKVELVNNQKWQIENQDGNKEIIIDKVELKHTIYIYNCNDSLIQVKGKVNAITVDNCSKTAVVFEDIVSSAEIVNSQSIQAQANGIVQTISIDKTDGAQIYLSEKSLGASIVSAKSSGMCINIPKDDDYVEEPVPEQYVSTVDPKTKKLKTVCAEFHF